ncbi:CLUMA_CG011136, isoform A [Clunio marinus]|uniref:CLUMA_CG011136, isoform A n=1 Tax=Clunio marinus TaxID=568069 RepID=A0A1J1IDX4_9DIPT|nr:CLUMA_CG011136, isoform A [Clunio marinus]
MSRENVAAKSLIWNKRLEVEWIYDEKLYIGIKFSYSRRFSDKHVHQFQIFDHSNRHRIKHVSIYA